MYPLSLSPPLAPPCYIISSNHTLNENKGNRDPIQTYLHVPLCFMPDQHTRTRKHIDFISHMFLNSPEYGVAPSSESGVNPLEHYVRIVQRMFQGAQLGNEILYGLLHNRKSQDKFITHRIALMHECMYDVAMAIPSCEALTVGGKQLEKLFKDVTLEMRALKGADILPAPRRMHYAHVLGPIVHTLSSVEGMLPEVLCPK
eukprot:PhF_6_TR4171/c0_g1_i1/m.5605